MGQHWAKHFPDAARRVITRPGAHAQIPLDDPVTISGALVNLIWRARAEGAAGNVIRIAIEADGLGCFVTEVGNDVTATFVPGETTAQEFFDTVNLQSSKTELVGSFNPTDVLIDTEDEFSFIDLEHGVDAQEGRFAKFFGPHFPLEGETVDPPVVTATTPVPAAIFAPRIEGLRVIYRWDTSVGKFEDFKEQRASNLEDPLQFYNGDLLLIGDEALMLRVQLAQHASSGAEFGLGLPYEATTLAADALGSLVALETPTASLDWATPGQRVLIVRGASDEIEFTDGVIQSIDSQTLTLEEDPGAVAVEGALIMPLVNVLLDPQQGFSRYRARDGAERWKIDAHAKRFGFPTAAIPGELAITGGHLDGVTFRARTPGVQVNMGLLITGVSIAITVTYDDLGNFGIDVHVPAGTTVGELSTALASNGLLWMLGEFDPDAVLDAGDQFGHIPFNPLTPFGGAAAASVGEMGLGATITMLGGKPLWDRELENSSTIDDSIDSGAELVEVGIGEPDAVSAVEVPDWGRAIAHSGSLGADFQWLKAFLATVKGQWKSFYLPTGRADLIPVDEASGNTLLVDASKGAYSLWAARGYNMLRVEQNGVARYGTIAADGEAFGIVSLTFEGDTLEDGPVDLISWCELVHLEKDVVEVVFRDLRFTVEMSARVVQQ